MRKFVRTYSPFLVYFVCVALAYFLCFYLFPKYNAALAYLGFLIIYTYIDIGGFILGFFMGKIIVKRSIDISFLLCLIYALISFGLMYSIISPIKKDINVPIETNKLSLSPNDSMKIENVNVKLLYI